MNKGYILLLAPRAAARRGAAAGGHLLRCRFSTMSPHRLRNGASRLPARRSRQNATFVLLQALSMGNARAAKKFGLRTIVGHSMLFSGSPIGYALPESEETHSTFPAPNLNTLQASVHQTGCSVLTAPGELVQRFGYKLSTSRHRRR
jgi:hypothetical protein